MLPKLSNFINGKFVPPVSGNYIKNINPSIGKPFNLIPDSDYRDVEQAIRAANAALPSWRTTTMKERARLLRSIGDEVRRQSSSLIRAECEDMGKPITYMSAFDINGAIGHWDLYARTLLVSSTPYYQNEDAVILEHRNAIGVVGLISPWNFPLHIFVSKVAAAIACGNTCVAKPSELSPNTAAMMCEIFAKLLPPGVVNVVHGYGAKAGQPIVESDTVRAISFTGGSVTGRLISSIAAPKLKKLQLELGGKNPAVVFDDCYFAEAVVGAAAHGFLNTGQVCCSGSRLLVQRSISDRFIAAYKKHVAETWAAHIGDPLLRSTQTGPLVSKTQFDKVKSYLELAKREGGTFILGGRVGGTALGLTGELADGYFVEPTIVLGLDHKCRCSNEEIFGPIVTVHLFDTEQEAIEIANEVDYGLGASVWTADAKRGHRVARQIEAGSVWINCVGGDDPRAPFGGFKDSGVGRENGIHSIEFFTEIKSIVSKL